MNSASESTFESSASSVRWTSSSWIRTSWIDPSRRVSWVVMSRYTMVSACSIASNRSFIWSRRLAMSIRSSFICCRMIWSGVGPEANIGRMVITAPRMLPVRAIVLSEDSAWPTDRPAIVGR